ncbi:MAG: SLBB domain-containing protein [Candidatus Protochlamydia sp.]|nr:SLBB domain-containing protein [Candidatus Protochlamydia sp.]
MPPRLPAHEWLIVSLLIISLLLLSFVTLFWKKNSFPVSHEQIELTNERIEVTVQGAVERPGIYELNKGSKLKDFWKICLPHPEADLRRFKPNSLLRDGQTLKVPFKEYITVHLKGAVASAVSLRVLKGTALKEMMHLIEVLPEGDLGKLNKQRRLKDQEIIHIPYQKRKKLR